MAGGGDTLPPNPYTSAIQKPRVQKNRTRSGGDTLQPQAFSHGNYTWLAAATARMSEAIGRERDAEQQEEQTDLDAFKAAQVAP